MPSARESGPTRPTNTTVATVAAIIARQVAELHALAGSPGERAIVARIAVQAIQRGLSAEARQ